MHLVLFATRYSVCMATVPSVATDVYFHNAATGELEALRVAPRDVRDGTATLARDGWAWQRRNGNVDAIISSLATECRLSRESDACTANYFASHPAAAASLVGSIASTVRDHMGGLVNVQCSSKFVTFARAGARPQNMHYDTVAAEAERDCRLLKPALGSDGAIHVRAWLPTERVSCAELLISNTTHMYTDACARRAASAPEQSASWKIYSRSEFVHDCAAAAEHASGVCSWGTTASMKRGEMLLFRNGFVMHGTARTAETGGRPCRRVSVAADCVVSLGAATVQGSPEL
jgi:hypothetical protein